MKLEEVVPWGRSLHEYRAMFSLRDEDLQLNILGCGDGPASFNAHWSALGGRVVSVDPIYAFSYDQILWRVEETYSTVVEQTRSNAHRFVWREECVMRFKDADHLGAVRLRVAETFLDDYFESGRKQGRYIAARLPQLPFADGTFDLGLCSHLLFLYSEQLGFDFHLASLREMARVCREVRVFPLLDLEGRPSPHLEECVRALRGGGLAVEVERVHYEFLRGANEMLRVRQVLG
jgi:SAM-dependent methyltransferase